MKYFMKYLSRFSLLFMISISLQHCDRFVLDQVDSGVNVESFSGNSSTTGAAQVKELFDGITSNLNAQEKN